MKKTRITFTNCSNGKFIPTAVLIEPTNKPEFATRVTIFEKWKAVDSYRTDLTPEQICDKYRRLMYFDCPDYQEITL